MVRPLVPKEPYPKLLDRATRVAHTTRARPDCVEPWTSHMEDSLVDDLDTSTGPRLLGNLPRKLHLEYSRDLTEGDLAALSTNRGSRPKSLVRIHSSHHSLAKCLATGMKQSQASLVTGYSQSRISILMDDPAFQALVADYTAEAKGAFADLAERMNNVSLDAIELLHERLQDNPEGFSIPVLLDVVKTFADRTGHGPNQEVTLKVDQNFIDRPPRENFDEWKARRARELGAEAPDTESAVREQGPKVLPN